MKVYVLEMDNGYEYSDNEHWVEGLFKTYHSATEYLLGKGFTVYPEEVTTGDWHLCFENSKQKKDKNVEAWIYDMDVQD